MLIICRNFREDHENVVEHLKGVFCSVLALRIRVFLHKRVLATKNQIFVSLISIFCEIYFCFHAFNNGSRDY